MSPEHAKKLDMSELLARMGFSPVHTKKQGKECWYRSPFRTEKTPSFHITFKSNRHIWVWNDFGEGAGGNLLDFLMRYRNENLGDVLKYLRTLYNNSNNDNQQQVLFSFHQKGECKNNFNLQNQLEEPVLSLIRAVPIQHPKIIDYLQNTRKISQHIFKDKLLEIHYWNKEKDRGFFAFGMKNNSQGYEIRSASDQYIFKSVLNTRDITHIIGRAGDTKSVNVFEGMLDYLSLLTFLKSTGLNNDSIILHSTSSYQKAIDFIEKAKYQSIHTFFDNDQTGQKVTEKFQADFINRVNDQRVLYSSHNDLNEALKCNQSLNDRHQPSP